jgi:hypothetical protein
MTRFLFRWKFVFDSGSVFRFWCQLTLSLSIPPGLSNQLLDMLGIVADSVFITLVTILMFAMNRPQKGTLPSVWHNLTFWVYLAFWIKTVGAHLLPQH